MAINQAQQDCGLRIGGGNALFPVFSIDSSYSGQGMCVLSRVKRNAKSPRGARRRGLGRSGRAYSALMASTWIASFTSGEKFGRP